MYDPDPSRSVLTERLAAERRQQGRVLWPALSAAIHLIAALYFIQLSTPRTGEIGAREPSQLLRFFPVQESGDVASDVRLELPANPVSPSLPDHAERPVVPPTAGPRVSTIVPSERSGSGSGSAGVPGATVAAPDGAGPSLERLRYRMPARDVWRRSDPPPRSAEEVVRERVAAQLNAYNDSVAADAAARARATDWTVTDADGGRWGVSPGAIHLGSITLPLPFTFSTPPGRREEVAGRLTNWTAIQQQATIVEGREIVKDRIKAIEQRKAAERAARQNPATTPGGTGGSTSGSSGGTGPRGS